MYSSNCALEKLESQYLNILWKIVELTLKN